jgi:hypothetical protein
MRKRIFLTLAVSAILVGSGGATAKLSSGSRPIESWATDGSIGSIGTVVRSRDTIYVGGAFSYVGPRTGPFIVLSTSDATIAASYPQISGEAPPGGNGEPVETVADDGAGGWFVGGSFRFVGGIECPRLAHIRADRTVDPRFCDRPDDTVTTLARAGSALYVGGFFRRIGGKSRARLAAIDLRTGGVSGWRADATGKTFSDGHGCCSQEVSVLAVRGSTLYVAGFFDHLGGRPHQNVAAVSVTTGRVMEWDPSVEPGVSGTVTSVAASDRTVYLGGFFQTVGGLARQRLAAVDAATGRVTSWNPAPHGRVGAIAVDGSRVYVGGDFTSIGGARRNGLAALDAADGRAERWDPRSDGAVDAIVPSGRTIYVSGGFLRIGGATRGGLAALDAVSGHATPWRPAPLHVHDRSGATAQALSLAGGRLAVGGMFETVGGVHRNNLAAINTRTGRPTPWNPGRTDGVINALAVSGTTVYLGGDFRHVDGQARSGLAAVDARTGRVTAWNPHVEPRVADLPQNGEVDAIAVVGSTVYVGGYFARIGGQARSSLAAIDARTGAVLPWNHGLKGPLTGGLGEAKVLLVSGNTLYVGGEFTTVDMVPRHSIAAIDAATGAVLPWDPVIADDVNDEVHALATSRSVVYLGGSFTRIGKERRAGTAAVDSRTGKLLAWDPQLAGGSQGTMVDALAVAGSKVIVGGDFGSVGGRPLRNLAAVDSRTTQPSAWSPLVPYEALALAVGQSKVYVAEGSGLDAFARPAR